MARRTRAREVALQVLYETDRNPQVPGDLDRRFIEQRLRGSDLRRFAGELVSGVRAQREPLDRLIQQVAENWSVSRMSPVDRNILRLAAYEIVFREDTPPKVAIDEAIQLAKRYGTADSPRFVNGLLDRILATHPRPVPPERASSTEEPLGVDH